MKKITFPPVNAETEAKLKRLVENISQLMGGEIKVESSVIVMAAEAPDGRTDINMVLKKLAGSLVSQALKGKTDKKVNG